MNEVHIKEFHIALSETSAVFICNDLLKNIFFKVLWIYHEYRKTGKFKSIFFFIHSSKIYLYLLHAMQCSRYLGYISEHNRVLSL